MSREEEIRAGLFDNTLNGRAPEVKALTEEGLAVGGEFRVNTTTSQDQHYSSVAFSDTGRFTVVWAGNGATDSTGIYSQRYLNPGITVPKRLWKLSSPLPHAPQSAPRPCFILAAFRCSDP